MQDAAHSVAHFLGCGFGATHGLSKGRSQGLNVGHKVAQDARTYELKSRSNGQGCLAHAGQLLLEGGICLVILNNCGVGLSVCFTGRAQGFLGVLQHIRLLFLLGLAGGQALVKSVHAEAAALQHLRICAGGLAQLHGFIGALEKGFGLQCVAEFTDDTGTHFCPLCCILFGIRQQGDLLGSLHSLVGFTDNAVQFLVGLACCLCGMTRGFVCRVQLGHFGDMLFLSLAGGQESRYQARRCRCNSLDAGHDTLACDFRQALGQGARSGRGFFKGCGHLPGFRGGFLGAAFCILQSAGVLGHFGLCFLYGGLGLVQSNGEILSARRVFALGFAHPLVLDSQSGGLGFLRI